MALRDLGALVIGGFLVFFVMTMIGIDLGMSASFARLDQRRNSPSLQTFQSHAYPQSAWSRCARRPALLCLLLVDQANLQIVQLRTAELLSHVVEGRLHLALKLVAL